jgi:predicted Zn-dependent peptidase
MKFHHTVLENGLTLVGEENPTALSMSAGYYVRTGARDETGAESGVSHFLEHMLFKGTERRSAEDVNREFDEMGADYNAFTGEEYTVYYGAVLPEFREGLVDLLTDMMRPTLRVEDFDIEKNVILEEIALYKDRPQFTVIDEARSTYYTGHPLGQSVLGTTESITALQRDQMYDYWSRRYAPNNLILALTGRFEWDEVVRQVKEGTRHWQSADSPRATPPFTPRSTVRVISNDKIARAHLALVAPGLAAQNEQRFVADIVGDMVGGGEGSRFFWDLVDPGIADSAMIGHDTEDGSGAYFGYASCDPERAQEVLNLIRAALSKVTDEGFRDDEIERAKRKVASALVISEETPRGRLNRLGFDWQYRQQYATVDEVIDRYLAVSSADVAAFMSTRPFDVLSVVALGPLTTLA